MILLLKIFNYLIKIRVFVKSYIIVSIFNSVLYTARLQSLRYHSAEYIVSVMVRRIYGHLL